MLLFFFFFFFIFPLVHRTRKHRATDALSMARIIAKVEIPQNPNL